MQEPRFFNRELSWLQFNQRVLEEAMDRRVPISERAKFCAIVSSNLDEFVMVRLAELLKKQDGTIRDAQGRAPREQLNAVRNALAKEVARQYECFRDLSGLLAENGLELVPREEWTRDDRLGMQVYFRQVLEPILTPLAVGPSHPFPLVGNLRLQLALELQAEANEEGAARYALVGVPANESRLVSLGGGRYALIEDVLLHSVAELFPGSTVASFAVFRVTRDGLFDIDEDHATDLLSEIEAGVRLRGHGVPVRLEVTQSAPEPLLRWLCEELELESADVIRVAGPLDLTFLFNVSSLSDALHAEQYEQHDPEPCPVDWEDPFEAMRERAVLLHHPYESFLPVVEFVEKAARDPKVVAIKQTLYRVSGDSPIVRALIQAAQAGKQITVLCELKARFDEQRNINWAKRLENAGAHVLYGVLGYKVHAKLLLVIRRDEDGIRRYVHVGTGNYNDRTARLYEDFSYFTTHPAVCRDVSKLFNMLTGFSRPPEWERLLVAPLTFRSTLTEWIRRETEHKLRGRPARIFAKMNSLVDVEVCELLYAASQAGVQIDLVIRGICILRPNTPGLSENIRVRSVVGRFLEHSRFFYFHNDSDPVYVIGSGDWMTRNLDRRVEALVQISEPEFLQRFDELMEAYLADRRSSRELLADGSYRHLGKEEPAGVGIQERLIQRYREAREGDDLYRQQENFTPARKPRSEDAYG